jgi:integrase
VSDVRHSQRTTRNTSIKSRDAHGKGRKDRATPLTSQTVKVMRTWLAELSPDPAGPLFPTLWGARNLHAL